jgi:hypothetical protein
MKAGHGEYKEGKQYNKATFIIPQTCVPHKE